MFEEATKGFEWATKCLSRPEKCLSTARKCWQVILNVLRIHKIFYATKSQIQMEVYFLPTGRSIIAKLLITLNILSDNQVEYHFSAYIDNGD